MILLNGQLHWSIEQNRKAINIDLHVNISSWFGGGWKVIQVEGAIIPAENPDFSTSGNEAMWASMDRNN